MIPYQQTVAQDAEVREMDSNVSRVFQSLQPNPLLNNPVILKGLVFVSGVDLTINTRLNRTVVGFIVINSNAAVSVYQSSTVNIAPTALIILKSNADAIVDILFF